MTPIPEGSHKGVSLLYWEVGGQSFEVRDNAIKHARKYKIPLREIQMKFQHKGD